MSKPEITIPLPSLSQSTDSFKELVSTLLLSLYEVRPHTGLLATYQLSRRLNIINLPTQLIWDELTRKIGYPTHYWREKCKQRFSESKNWDPKICFKDRPRALYMYILRTSFLLSQKCRRLGNLSKGVNLLLKDIHLFTQVDKMSIFWVKICRTRVFIDSVTSSSKVITRWHKTV